MKRGFSSLWHGLLIALAALMALLLLGLVTFVFGTTTARSASADTTSVTATFTDASYPLYTFTATAVRTCVDPQTISGAGSVTNAPNPLTIEVGMTDYDSSAGNPGAIDDSITVDPSGEFNYSLPFGGNNTLPTGQITMEWNSGSIVDANGDHTWGGTFVLPALNCSGGGTTTTTTTGSTTTTTAPPVTTTTLPPTTTTTVPPVTTTTPPPSTTTTTPPTVVSTSRISGSNPSNRIGTAIAVSEASFANGAASAVVLARDDMYPDALTGGPLAAAKHGPVLLTEPTALNSATQAEIERVLPTGGTVYLLGGTSALSTVVASSIQALGDNPVRVAGSNRFATAVAVAKALGDPGVDFLATGLNFPDALSAGPAAISQHGAILLTNGTSQAAPTGAYLSATNPGTVYAIGGEACSADQKAICIADSDRFGTAVAVAEKFFPYPGTIGIATGLNFPDALAADPLLGSQDAPLVLVNPNVPLPANTLSYLSSIAGAVHIVEILGGSAAVSSGVAGDVEEALQP